MALVNQTALANGEPTVGFVNPIVYALAQRADYTNNFHDITVGNNQRPGSGAKFSATPGYDLCTGLGTPTTALIDALGIPEALHVSQSGPLIFSGPASGPIIPLASNTFALYTASPSTFNWTLVNTSSWFTASPAGGTLNAAVGRPSSREPHSAATSLPAGAAIRSPCSSPTSTVISASAAGHARCRNSAAVLRPTPKISLSRGAQLQSSPLAPRLTPSCSINGSWIPAAVQPTWLMADRFPGPLRLF